MAEPTAAETIPKTIIREAQPATPTAGSSAELAKKVNEEVDAVGFREGLELAKKTPIAESKISQKIEQIGIERDDTTGAKARTPEEQQRYDSAKISSELTSKFVESGYDSLNDVQKGFVRNKLLTELRSRPALASEMSGLNNTQQIALAERLLRDPSYINKSRERLEEILDNPNFDETAITNAQYYMEDAQIEQKDKDITVKEINDRIKSNNAQLKEYARAANGIATGSLAIEMDAIKTNLNTIKSELLVKKQELSSATSRVDALKEERSLSMRYGATAGRRAVADIDSELITARGDVTTAQTEVNTRQQQIDRLNELTTSEQQLKERKTELAEEKREKDKALQKANIDLRRKQQILEDLKTLRTGQEQDLVDNLGNVFESATGKWINDQVEAATTEMDKQLVKLKETTNDNNKKAMYDALRERWLGAQRTRRKGLIGFRSAERYRPIDRNVTNADFAVLIQSGPDQLARNILDGRTNPTTNAHYTLDEINSLIQNKEFMAEMRPEMVKQLLTRKHLTGGFTHEDIFLLEQSPWGKGMINEAIANVDKYKGVIESAFGAGALNTHGFKDKFIQIARNNPLWMLLLLGIPVAAIGALTMQATAESIQQQY